MRRFFRRPKHKLFNLLIRETSQSLCYERLLNLIYVAYKNVLFCKMQFWSHSYTVVSYQALFRLSVYKIPTVYLSGSKNVCFCTIRDFGSPTFTMDKLVRGTLARFRRTSNRTIVPTIVTKV